ncbi:hypothetical protein D3C75_1285830 [compost metagenome]
MVDRPPKKRLISLGRTHFCSVSRLPRALVVYSQYPGRTGWVGAAVWAWGAAAGAPSMTAPATTGAATARMRANETGSVFMVSSFR